MEFSLNVYHRKRLIFQSSKNWLYPLFELETFLEGKPYAGKDLLVHDKIIGKAAAMLMIYFNIETVRAGVLSSLGKEALETAGIAYEYVKLVDRIACKTEELLVNETDAAVAYQLVRKRAGLSI